MGFRVYKTDESVNGLLIRVVCINEPDSRYLIQKYIAGRWITHISSKNQTYNEFNKMETIGLAKVDAMHIYRKIIKQGEP